VAAGVTSARRRKEVPVKHLVIALVLALALAAAIAATALADTGPPGSTYPEQPGSHNQKGCAAVISNPGTGVGGQAGQSMSSTAGAITSGLLADACFGG
jgi:hypothetical protein